MLPGTGPSVAFAKRINPVHIHKVSVGVEAKFAPTRVPQTVRLPEVSLPE